jgi:hypothetical protein
MDDKPIVKPVMTSKKFPIMIGAAIVIVLVGLGIGWIVSSKKVSNTANLPKDSAVTVSQNEAGVKDLTNYKDTATGTLQKGGLQGEGTYHLVREGGATHTVYLNSTVVDMSPFVGKKVQVWGQTQASHFTPWLMDVGKIQVVQ